MTKKQNSKQQQDIMAWPLKRKRRTKALKKYNCNPAAHPKNKSTPASVSFARPSLLPRRPLGLRSFREGQSGALARRVSTTRGGSRVQKATGLEAPASVCIWDQWIAGLIDAGGHFGLHKQRIATCEIRTPLNDEPILREIQNQYGGSVKRRAGSASVRWRLADRESMMNLCTRVNGHIRLDRRRKQFEHVCSLFNIIPLPPIKLTSNSGYIAGLFDGDGRITLSVSKTSPLSSILPGACGKAARLSFSPGDHHLSMHIDSTDKHLLESCRNALSLGSVISKQPSSDRGQIKSNIYYRWYWQSYDQVCFMQAYFRQTAVGRSVKHKRLILLKHFFELKRLKFHLSHPHSAAFKRWAAFCHCWFGFSIQVEDKIHGDSKMNRVTHISNAN